MVSNPQLTKDQFVDFVRNARLAVVATVSGDHNPQAGVVDLAVLDNGDLLFATKNQARKVGNLDANARVALVSGWQPISLQIEGEAQRLVGDEKEAMAAEYAAQLPKRPPVTDAFALYRVTPDWLRYYEARSGQPPLVVEGMFDR